MQKTSRFLYWLLPLFVLIGLSVAFHGHLGDAWRSLSNRVQTWVASRSAGPPAETPVAVEEGKSAAQPAARHPIPATVPATAPETVPEQSPAETAKTLPPSPPLPQLSPESGQEERHAAFGLFKSIDFIVLRDEPFEVAGNQWTVRRMQSEILGLKDFQPVIPMIQETEIGPSVRKPVRPSSSGAAQHIYYAVRIVRPHESLWNIHYAILREYLGRRQIEIPANADRPLADGRSSGVGRVLKFFEGIVSLYDFDDVRGQHDLDEIRPFKMIVFFRISELFAALDQLKVEDINRLRYIGDMLRLVHPDQARDLLDRKVLREVPEEQQ